MGFTYLASRIYNVPLLISQPKLDIILSVLKKKMSDDSFNEFDESFDELLTKPVTRLDSIKNGSIAVIPVYGTLVKRTYGLNPVSGLMSYQDINTMLDAALADSNIAGILLDVDSSGGEIYGVFELSRKIRESVNLKPIWAIANDTAFSAAYAIASSAERLFVTETGGVGSIGVIALHVDQSLKDAKDGYRYTAVIAGAHKNDFSPHESLSDTARNELQAEVNRIYDIFVSHVSNMRGLSKENVQATEAALYFGPNAVTVGLADDVLSFEQVMLEFSQTVRKKFDKKIDIQYTDYDKNNQISKEASMEDVFDKKEAKQENVLTETDGRKEAQIIAELCLIAGQPHRTAEFLAAGLSSDEVRKILIEHRTKQINITSHITADAGTSQRPEDSPIVAAVKKLINKE